MKGWKVLMNKGRKFRLLKNLKSHRLLALAGAISAVFIIALVLFYPPMPGVADQGDFERIMSVTGLTEIGNDSTHWFKYVTTEYKMVPLNTSRLIGLIPTTSMIYPIAMARVISRLVGSVYFNTRYLALVYAAIYVLSLYTCFRCIKFKRVSTNIFFILLSILILMDGNYLVWFNSLYGEPMMITSLLCFIASLLYIYQNVNKINVSKILMVSIPAYLFLGAKLQCFVALPLIALLLIRLASFSSKRINAKKIMNSYAAIIVILVLSFYVSGNYAQISSRCGVDTMYNSVFYGILKESKDPEKDLEILGLSPDMAVDAGKHAYLPKKDYIRYAPWSHLTITEFNDRMNNSKLLKFYLLQPKRLIKGMEYTASKSFNTMGSLGKYEKTAVNKYTYTFNRFTLWSNIRNSVFPKTLLFFVPFYIGVLIITIMEYRKNKGNKEVKLRIELLWTIMMIGLLQFPMPFIGNGEADTAKQLFLFNYTFDIVFLCAAVWIFDRAYLYFTKYVI